MKARLFLAIAITLVLGGALFAQDKVEVTGDSSYYRFNPGLPSLWNSQNLNGGGGQVALYLNNWFGVAADLQGYGSYTQCVKQGDGLRLRHRFTYLFGPQVKYRAASVSRLPRFFWVALTQTSMAAPAATLPGFVVPDPRRIMRLQ
jgi:hypothetical protein